MVAAGNLLIVNDTFDNLRFIDRILSQHGYRVQTVVSGQMALVVVKTAMPELILLDVCASAIDSYEVCRKLKADPRTGDIPIIFLSASSETVDKVKAFDAGGVDYVTKPFYTAEVLARVETHLTLRRLQQQLQQQNRLLKQEIHNRMVAETSLQAVNIELQQLVNIDDLTQIANRRCFENCLQQEWRRLTRAQLPLSLIFCDVDYFKRYNDTYGHLAGDDCLRHVAKILRSAVERPADLVARYGGEEFAVLLPNTPMTGAIQIAEKIQSGMKQLQQIHATSSVSQHVTLSMGIATLIPILELPPNQLIAAADKALYRAKAKGRDQIMPLNLWGLKVQN